MHNPDNHPFQLFDGSGRRYILSDQLESIGSAIEFMDLVLNTNDTCFATTTTPTGRRSTKLTRLGTHIKRLKRYAQLFDPTYSFNPALRLFFDEYRMHKICDYDGLGPHPIPSLSVQARDVFDDFVQQLRSRAREIGLRKAIADWRSKFKKNTKRALNIESSVFERHARLLVIRLDLGYRAATFTQEEIERIAQDYANKKLHKLDECYWSGEDISETSHPEVRIAFEEVQRDRKRLFANMKGKPSLFRHLIAYLSRIELTPVAGYHLHLVLFFNGAEKQKHQWLAHEIGLYWNERVTQGRGRFHNCNADWDENHPDCGIGMINHYDREKRINLRERVLSYLSKDEQHVEILPYKGCNLFAAGFVHRGLPAKSGRPRTRHLSDCEPAMRSV